MKHYRNLLYISHGTSNETEGLKQALSLARNNDAPLCIMIISPEFPKEFPEYEKKYQDALQKELEASIEATKKLIHLEDIKIDINVELITDKTPAIKIIQHAVRHGHDLVIKEADPREKTTGFKALDMDLLRKCPVPVWLCRPIEQSRQDIRVAVAIDPKSAEPAAEDLSKRMLQLSRSLADSCSGELHIISCWNYEFESLLRNSPWFKTPDAEIAAAIASVQQGHREALDNLIKASGVDGAQHIHHLRGQAPEQIPQFVKDKGIDILVMGTVARTGIPGFMIGNTAENIVQKLECTLMALKPHDFISPVKVS
jgi:nucleotide-binding universal stress UspA family protein